MSTFANALTIESRIFIHRYNMLRSLITGSLTRDSDSVRTRHSIGKIKLSDISDIFMVYVINGRPGNTFKLQIQFQIAHGPYPWCKE